MLIVLPENEAIECVGVDLLARRCDNLRLRIFFFLLHLRHSIDSVYWKLDFRPFVTKISQVWSGLTRSFYKRTCRFQTR